MRRPASIHPWLSPTALQAWVRKAHNREEYQKRLAVWLTHIGPFPAHRVATLLAVSKQAVWLWVSQYNLQGPRGLQRRGRGGRRRAYLTLAEEKAFLAEREERIRQGRVVTTRQMHGELCRQLGKRISLGYLYGLLHRHGWRKGKPSRRLVPAPPPKPPEPSKRSSKF